MLIVTTAKIAANAVTATELASNSVITAKINNDAVTYAKIQNISTENRLALHQQMGRFQR